MLKRARTVHPLLAGLVLLAWLLLLWAVRREHAVQHTRSAFEVVTFNAQFLPGPARLLNKRPRALYRAAALARSLRSFDVIALNEVFDKECRTLLLEELEASIGPGMHVVTSAPQAVSPLGIGSGLVLVTRHPVLLRHCITYGNRPLAHGVFGDGIAAKGALHARVHLEGAGPVDVFVTHLESRDAGIREAQLSRLADFIRKHSSPKRPLLLFGDLNIAAGGSRRAAEPSQYRRLLCELKDAYPHGRVTDLGAGLDPCEAGTSDADRADGGRRIDYIFLANPADARPSLKPREVKVEPFKDERVKTLSDHLAVTARLIIAP